MGKGMAKGFPPPKSRPMPKGKGMPPAKKPAAKSPLKGRKGTRGKAIEDTYGNVPL